MGKEKAGEKAPSGICVVAYGHQHFSEEQNYNCRNSKLWPSGKSKHRVHKRSCTDSLRV